MSRPIINLKCQLTAASKKAIAANKKKVLEFIDQHQYEIMCDYAIFAVKEAVAYYEKHYPSLTGNTLAGFGAAVYKDGKLCKGGKGRRGGVFMANEIAGITPTHTYTKPGDKGFLDYSHGELGGPDGTVKPYSPPLSFMYVGPNGHGYIDTSNFLYSGLAESKAFPKGYTVIVANVSPYVEYLDIVRDFDILDSVHRKSPSLFMSAVNRNVPAKTLNQ